MFYSIVFLIALICIIGIFSIWHERKRTKEFPVKKLAYGSLIAAKRLRKATQNLLIHVGSMKDTDMGSSIDYFKALEILDDTEWLDSLDYPNA